MYQQLGNDIRDVFRWDDKNDLISRKKTFPIYFLLEQSEFNASLRLLHDYYQGHIDFSKLIPNKHSLYQAMKQSKVEEAAMIMQKKWMNQALNIFDDLKTINLSNVALKRLLFPE
jgi:competence protein ComQ